MIPFPLPRDINSDPQFLGATDAAVALYTKAASWSAERPTDGFVPTAALSLFTANHEQATAELVERGVWRRARGGFQFASWPKQCTAAYMEDQREAWRRRQTNHRTSKDVPSRRDSRVSHAQVTPESNRESRVFISSNTRDKEQPPPTSGVARKSRIPADFAVDEAMVAWARESTPLVGKAETANFVDYWTAAAGPTSEKKDWVAAWRYWMRKAQADAERRRPGGAQAGGQPTSGSKRMDKALAALAPDDPFRAEYAANQAAAQQPADWLMIEGGQSA